MELAEEFITFIVKRVLEKRRPELETIGRDIAKLEKIATPFPRITYDEAVKMLQEGHAKGLVENKFEYGGDFGSPDETYISSQFDRPVMIHRYPAAVKAFYMEPDPERPDLALCVDVLAPEGYGEIIGGSQRMASYELLLERIHAARAAGRGVQVVSRPAQVRRRAARRLRHGHRARGGVDLRPGTRARDHSVPAHAAPAVSVRVEFAIGRARVASLGRIVRLTRRGWGSAPERLQRRRSQEHRGTRQRMRLTGNQSSITKPIPEHRIPSNIRVIGVPLDLGQSRRGVDMGPSAMRVAGLEAKLEALGYDVKDGGNVPRRHAGDRRPKAIRTRSI